jgi:hypothetical protein
MTRIILTAAFVVLYSTAALADASFQFQMPGVKAPAGDDVNGMRLVFLYGKNNSVRGFDLGFAAIAEAKNQSGFSFNMGLSKVTGTSKGCACSLINVHEGQDSGVNVAFVNVINDATKGVNVGFLNLTEGTSGVDIGAISSSKKSKTQIGLVNFTDEITSLQIGFLNFADNGFFPMFPFFNYPKE